MLSYLDGLSQIYQTNNRGIYLSSVPEPFLLLHRAQAEIVALHYIQQNNSHLDNIPLFPLFAAVISLSSSGGPSIFATHNFLEQRFQSSDFKLRLRCGLPSEGHPCMFDHCLPVLASVQKSRAGEQLKWEERIKGTA